MMEMHAKWVEVYLKDISNLSDADFAIMKINTTNVLAAKYKSLEEKTMFLTDQLDNGLNEFDIEEKYISAIKHVSKEDLITFAN